MALSYFKDGEWKLPGRLLSVTSALKDDTQTSTSVGAGAFVDISGLSVTVTPQSASSKFLVASIVHGNNARDANLALAIKIERNGSDIFMPASVAGTQTAATSSFYNSSTTDADITNVAIYAIDAPATTASVTYKVRAGNLDNSPRDLFINRPRGTGTNEFYSRVVSSLLVFEVV